MDSDTIKKNWYKAFAGVLITLQTISLALSISTIFLPEFISINSHSLQLYQCSSSFCLFTSYSDNLNYYCDLNSSTSACKLFQGLYYGMISYLVCVSITIVLMILWIILTFSYFFNKNNFYPNILIGILIVLSHVTGFISYAVQANVNFSNCNQNYGSNQQPRLCPSLGIGIALAVSALNIIIYATFFIFASKINSSTIRRMRRDKASSTKVSTINNCIDLEVEPIGIRYSDVPKSLE